MSAKPINPFELSEESLSTHYIALTAPLGVDGHRTSAIGSNRGGTKK